MEGVNHEVPGVSKDGVWAAMKRTNSGEAGGPDDIPVKAWGCLDELAMFLFVF